MRGAERLIGTDVPGACTLGRSSLPGAARGSPAGIGVPRRRQATDASELKRHRAAPSYARRPSHELDSRRQRHVITRLSAFQMLRTQAVRKPWRHTSRPYRSGASDNLGSRNQSHASSRSAHEARPGHLIAEELYRPLAAAWQFAHGGQRPHLDTERNQGVPLISVPKVPVAGGRFSREFRGDHL